MSLSLVELVSPLAEAGSLRKAAVSSHLEIRQEKRVSTKKIEVIWVKSYAMCRMTLLTEQNSELDHPLIHRLLFHFPF